MTSPEQMVKCRIVTPKSKLSAVINTLYDLGLYHLTPHLKGNYDLDISEPLADADKISKLLVKLRAIISKYPLHGVQIVKPLILNKKTLSPLVKKIDNLHTNLINIESEIKEAVIKKVEIKEKLISLEILKKLDLDFEALNKSKHLTYLFGNINKTEGLEQAVQKITDECSIAKNSKYVFLVGKKADEGNLLVALNEFGFSPFNININFSNVSVEIKKEKSLYQTFNEQHKEAEQKLNILKKELPGLLQLEIQLSEEIRKQELPLNFATTKSSIMAEGWIPKLEQENVREALEKATNKTIMITYEEPAKKEEPPVKLHNKKLVSPFEFLLKLYDLPKYKEIDPTSILFITFPIFFGFMLGDIGYGLVLLLAFYFIKKKFNTPGAKQLLSALMFAAVVSILFGFVFGEIFGFEAVGEGIGVSLCENIGICLHHIVEEVHGHTEVLYEFPRLLNRAGSHMNVFGYEILSVLVIGAIIGFIHLNLGLLFGFVNEYYSHGLKHAFMAKISWMIMELGIILAVLGVMGILVPVMKLIGALIAVLGIVLLALGEGVQGVVEIPALFSNMLSYMRLGAVGLASVGLAVVVNENLAMPFFEKGGIFIFIAIIIMILGHGINILLGVIGPFLHGVRLHYVEFFSKFFHGGGEEYNPFTRGEKIVQEK